MRAWTQEDYLDFANRCLFPWQVKGAEIVPEYCPICHGGNHGDKYTFALNVEHGVYCCKRASCGMKGTVNQLVHLLAYTPPSYNGSNFGMAIGHGGISPSFPHVQEQSFQKCNHPPMERTPEIDAYFEKRGIHAETLDAFHVGSTKYGDIAFPFYLDNEIVYYKFRPMSEKGPKEWAAKNTKPILFGMDLCSPGKPLVITEGQIDALSLHEVGVRNVVSVPSGCEDFRWVEYCWDWLEKYDEIILFGDSDDPGKKMVETLIRKLDEARCKVVRQYPLTDLGLTCKDANEILIECGAQVLLDTLQQAEQATTRGLLLVSEIEPVDPTTVPRIMTGIPALDGALGGLAAGELTILTGQMGVGKSTLAGIMVLMALQQDKAVCAYSGELTKNRFLDWICRQAAGSDYITLKYDPITQKQVPVVPKNVTERIQKWFGSRFFLFDNNEVFEGQELDAILHVFDIAARRYDCKVFLLDNIMSAIFDTENEYTGQAELISRMDRFAKRYGVHVIIVAHARKLQKGGEMTSDDVSGNSVITKVASNVIQSMRPNLKVLKARYEGETCLIECAYCPDSHRIYQATGGHGDNYEFSWDKTGITMPSIRADSLPEYQPRYPIVDMFG